METRYGLSYGIEVIFGDYEFSSASLVSLDFNIPLCGVPYGTGTLVTSNDDGAVLNSGSWGMFQFIDTGIDSLDNTGYTFYCTSLKKSRVNQLTTKCEFSWILGTPKSISQDTFVYDGSSIDALSNVLKHFGYEVDDKISSSGVSTTDVDTMKWRFVDGNMADCLNEVAEYSIMHGDYLTWAFNERERAYTISSLKTAMDMKVPQILSYSVNANNSTSNVERTDSETGATIWLYQGFTRDSVQGNMIQYVFPNAVLENVGNNGILDVVQCDGKYFDNAISSMGGVKSNIVRAAYGLSDDNSTYGVPEKPKTFPGNTHKFYSIAPMMRNRIIGEYCKRQTIVLCNSIGPAVGSAVIVASFVMTMEDGNIGYDTVYTDKYIVAAKKITKDASTYRGMLGASYADENPDYYTVLTLMSNVLDSSNYDATVADINKFVKNTSKDA